MYLRLYIIHGKKDLKIKKTPWFIKRTRIAYSEQIKDKYCTCRCTHKLASNILLHTL